MVCSSCGRATGFDNGLWISWDYLSLRVNKLADGVGIAPTQPGGSLGFQDRGITALPTIRNGQGGGSCTLVAVRKHPPRSRRGRLPLTLHPEIGCQGWTRTNTERLNRPPCYFDTTWHGAAGRTPTCIVPLRRRMPNEFDHDSKLKLVGTAGFPPAASRAQAGRSED